MFNAIVSELLITFYLALRANIFVSLLIIVLDLQYFVCCGVNCLIKIKTYRYSVFLRRPRDFERQVFFTLFKIVKD